MSVCDRPSPRQRVRGLSAAMAVLLLSTSLGAGCARKFAASQTQPSPAQQNPAPSNPTQGASPDKEEPTAVQMAERLLADRAAGRETGAPQRSYPPIPQFESTPPQPTDAAALTPITVAPDQVPPEPDLSGLDIPAPVRGQKGIVIWEPVVRGVGARAAAFGTGCGRWLHFAVAGQAELGAEPAWMTPERFLKEMNRKDLRLTTAQARDGARRMGVPRTAAGVLTGSGTRLALTYTVYDVATGKAVGAPVSASGTPSQVRAALPGMAEKLSIIAGVAKPHVPKTVRESEDDLAAIAAYPWRITKLLPYGQLRRLEAMAKRSPLAGLTVLDAVKWQDPKETATVAKDLLALAPQNTLAISEAARTAGYQMGAHAQAIQKLAKAHPNNYLLTRAALRVQTAWMDDENIVAIKRAVAAMPNSPDAWNALSGALMDQAEGVRQGKFSTEMTEQEWQIVGEIYPQAEAAAIQAVRLDPQYGYSWQKLAETAQFNGSDGLADFAFWMAVHLDHDNDQLWFWGTQMFQPKWQGGQEKLDKVARLAGMAKLSSPLAGLRVGNNLKRMNYRRETRQQLLRVEKQYRALVQERPDAAHWRYGLGETLRLLDRPKEAIPHYRAALDNGNDDYETRFCLGLACLDAKMYSEAEAVFTKLSKVNPNDRWLAEKLAMARARGK